MPGVIGLGSLFTLFAVEMYLHTKIGGHSHGGATGEGIVGDEHARAAANLPVRPTTPIQTITRVDSYLSDDDSIKKPAFSE